MHASDASSALRIGGERGAAVVARQKYRASSTPYPYLICTQGWQSTWRCARKLGPTRAPSENRVSWCVSSKQLRRHPALRGCRRQRTPLPVETARVLIRWRLKWQPSSCGMRSSPTPARVGYYSISSCLTAVVSRSRPPHHAFTTSALRTWALHCTLRLRAARCACIHISSNSAAQLFVAQLHLLRQRQPPSSDPSPRHECPEVAEVRGLPTTMMHVSRLLTPGAKSGSFLNSRRMRFSRCPTPSGGSTSMTRAT